MRIRTVLIILTTSLLFGISAFAAEPNSVPNVPTAELVKFTVENQHDTIAPSAKTAVAIHFDVNKDWHFYSNKATAPGGVSLTIEPNSAEFFTFEPPVIPKGQTYDDTFTGTTTDILTEKFTVYLPYTIKSDAAVGTSKIGFTIRGALCSEQQCRMTKLATETAIDISPNAPTDNPKFSVPSSMGVSPMSSAEKTPSLPNEKAASYSTFAALLLAFAAGIILNIMPCVLPVIPLKVLSIFEQAKESKFRCVALGLTFCLGILVFFAVIAVANIVLRLSYNSVFQWGDHFRNPLFIIGMALLMEVLALIMFGMATVTIPSYVGATGGRPLSQGGYAGSIGMGFLAALLSTPCSFAILTAAFAWAQTQSLWLATVAIMIIGLGMAAPYALLTSMPSLLKHLPKPGRWMEIFKQAMGFVLLIVAVWLASVLPCSAHLSLFYYGLILAFCVWMWGGWVSFDTAPAQKWSVRIIAVIIAIVAGWWLLPSANIKAAPQGQFISEGIAWQPYDANAIKEAIADDRPVLIEFTADWCLTCKAVEKTVYARKDIQDLLKQKNVLVIKGDATWAENPATIALKEVYNEPGVPATIVLVPGKTEPIRLHGLVIGSELKKILEELTLYAKRIVPKDVKPIECNSVIYSVPHFLHCFDERIQPGGYVLARDAKTKRIRWLTQIYVTDYDKALEEDVQDVFITAIKLDKESLIINDEQDRTFKLNIKTLEVKMSTPLAVPDNNTPLTIIIRNVNSTKAFLQGEDIKFDDIWIPEQIDLTAVDGPLQDYLRDNRNDYRQICNSMETYVKEYSGFVRSNKRFIVCNMYKSSARGGDGKRFTIIFDGGCSVIRFIYDVQNKKVISLKCNGEA